MLKVGDKIKVKENLNERVSYKMNIVSAMVDFAGMEGKIIKAFALKENPYYRLSIDKGEFIWSDDTFDLVE